MIITKNGDGHKKRKCICTCCDCIIHLQTRVYVSAISHAHVSDIFFITRSLFFPFSFFRFSFLLGFPSKRRGELVLGVRRFPGTGLARRGLHWHVHANPAPQLAAVWLQHLRPCAWHVKRIAQALLLVPKVRPQACRRLRVRNITDC